MVVREVNQLLAMPVIHIGAQGQLPVAAHPVQPHVNETQKAEEDGPSFQVPDSQVGNLDGLPGSLL